MFDKTIHSISKQKHFKSKTHSWFENSIISNYIILNPLFEEVDETMRSYVNSYNEKYEDFDVRCLLKLLMTTNRVRCIRINPQSSLHYSFYVPKKSISSKTIHDRYFYFSQLK